MSLEVPRRRFLLGLASLMAESAIIRIAPIREVSLAASGTPLCLREITRAGVLLFKNSNLFLENLESDWLIYQKDHLL